LLENSSNNAESDDMNKPSKNPMPRLFETTFDDI
jgi:hypothetical protein